MTVTDRGHVSTCPTGTGDKKECLRLEVNPTKNSPLGSELQLFRPNGSISGFEKVI